MNITLHWMDKDTRATASATCGGEYSIPNLEVYLDPDLPPEEHGRLVIHAVVENFLPFLSHDKVEEFSDKLWEALEAYENGDIT